MRIQDIEKILELEVPGFEVDLINKRGHVDVWLYNPTGRGKKVKTIEEGVLKDWAYSSSAYRCISEAALCLESYR